MKSKSNGGTSPTIMIKAALDLIHTPGSVFEVRIPKTRAGTISGYFDDTAIAATLIAKENGKHQGIYATVNPISPALLARAHNVLIPMSNTTTSDGDIAKRHWFLIDIDPVRPAGISSSEEEHTLAEKKANEVIEWLSSIGWPEPMVADSGNGFHIMYRVDLPNTDPVRVDFEFAVKMLSSIFSDDTNKVDSTVFNASRIWKVYGTLSAKGSSTPSRPHRVASITRVPKEFVLLTHEQIENVARPLRDAKPEEYHTPTGEYITDMAAWLAERGQTVTSGPRPMFGNEGQKWTISCCPFNNSHVNPMVGLVNNRPVYRCLHDSCSGFRWKEFRSKIDPNYSDPDVITQRVKDWLSSDATTMEGDLVQSICQMGKTLPKAMTAWRKIGPRSRFLLLEDIVKAARRKFAAETIGENNEKGNIVGVINRIKQMQEDGSVPMFWMSEYDQRIRVGKIGSVNANRLTEEAEIEVMVRFHTAGETWIKQVIVSQAIKHLAASNVINPLKIHLKSLRWDGTKRLDSWLIDYMGVKDTVYTRAVGRKWFISAAARGMDPGCQADHMLIMEGKQGVGKSQALRAIGGQFYVEYSGGLGGPGTAHKDMVAATCGKMIIEMSELASLRRADMEALKAVLTTTVDEVRLSYERDSKSYPRTCVFAGTTNETGGAYIADHTGARRFWPVHVGECGVVRSALLKQDAEQLWAEAVEAYESGEDWWSVPIEETLEEQADRQVTLEGSDPWYAKIRSALTDPSSYDNEIFTVMPEYVNGQATGGFIVRAGAAGTILGVLLHLET